MNCIEQNNIYSAYLTSKYLHSYCTSFNAVKRYCIEIHKSKIDYIKRKLTELCSNEFIKLELYSNCPN